MIELASPGDIAAIMQQWRTEEKMRARKTEGAHPAYKPAARKRAKEDDENERWNRIWEEKIEDKSYYAR